MKFDFGEGGDELLSSMVQEVLFGLESFSELRGSTAPKESRYLYKKGKKLTQDLDLISGDYVSAQNMRIKL